MVRWKMLHSNNIIVIHSGDVLLHIWQTGHDYSTLYSWAIKTRLIAVRWLYLATGRKRLVNRRGDATEGRRRMYITPLSEASAILLRLI